MKLIASSIVFFCGGAVLTQAEYVDYIIETHYDANDLQDGISIPHNLSDLASITSQRPVVHKVIYELIAINPSDNADSYILDTKTIYAEAPQAEVTIVSDSSATGIPRTRADQPFYVTYTVNNLKEVEDTRLNSAILVYQTDAGKIFDEDITTNTLAKTKSYNPMSLFTSGTAESLSGSVVFSIVENDQSNTYNDEFASQEILILPKHSGSMTGINDGETYTTLPTVSFTIQNVYPQATVQLRVFKSSEPNNYKAIESSATFLNPKDELLSPGELSSVALNDGYIDSDGEWTVQWVHTSTAWGEEVVDEVQFTYKSTLNIRARISTSN
ncbi:hypothetical protein [Rubritalea marina]|uniref:hypothetical protein n=1 Tax=Rubritalea marina TaxID=361055 RepID=UPI00037E4879|nr:hypothetical protein [Rubritalea marina]